MRIHLAGCEGDTQKKRFDAAKPPYALATFAKCVNSPATQERVLSIFHADYCKGALLDSGAFTFFTDEKKKTISEWERYIDAYADFIINGGIDYFFELDIDVVVGLPKVEEFRRRLEKRTGKQSIPVWHINRGFDYFKRMCDEYSYVSIGGIAKTPNGKKLSTIFPYFIDYAHKTNTEIHGLGFTETAKLKTYKFDSVDSTSWLSGARYGQIYYPRGGTLKTKSARDFGMRLEGQAVTIENLKVWTAYAKMMDT